MHSGGGNNCKSLAALHHAARQGLADEFGVDFYDKAVVSVSPPRIVIQPQHRPGDSDNPWTTVFVQYVMIKREYLKKVDEPHLGEFHAPSTPGDWGQWELDGEKLHCQEKQRQYDKYSAKPENKNKKKWTEQISYCLLYTSPSPRD